jgi:hypothetical protein
MASAVAYLDQNTGPEIPFQFHLGDLVVSTTGSVSLSGEIVWGRCRYTLGGGAYESIYEVELSTRRHFLARDTEIQRLHRSVVAVRLRDLRVAIREGRRRHSRLAWRSRLPSAGT